MIRALNTFYRFKFKLRTNVQRAFESLIVTNIFVHKKKKEKKIEKRIAGL